MIKAAYLYRDEINKKMAEIAFNPKYMFYNFGTCWYFDYKISDNSWEKMQFVSLDSRNCVLGYLCANVDRDSDKISNLGIINFQNTNLTFSHDLRDFLTSLFDKFNYRKIEFNVIIGNPIEQSYDRVIAKYGGRIVGIRKESVKLMDNQYHDEKMYEIFRSEYKKAKGAGVKFLRI